MASIQKRDNGKWRARYRDESGKEHARHFVRKLDAQRWLDEVSASQIKGEYIDPKDARITVEQYAQQWEQTLMVSLSRKRGVKGTIKNHIIPALGTMRIGRLRKSDIQGFVTQLDQSGLRPGTIRTIYGILMAMLNAAVEDRVLMSNPGRKIRLPAKTEARLTIPTIEEVRILMEHNPALVGVMALGGLRLGEALGLNPSDIDFSAKTLNVERQLTNENELTLPKTRSSIRHVPLGESLLSILEKHVASLPANAEALFLNDIDTRMSQFMWQRTVRRLAKEHGFSFTSHDLRHFAASALISGGATVKQVQTVLGHASAVITLQTYAHLWPGDDERVRAVMDRTAEALTGPQTPRNGPRSDAGAGWHLPPVWDS